MRLFLRRGRILRIRPGHLANFSGGAGYMPFIIIWSVPASLLFGLVGAIVLYVQGKVKGRRASVELAQDDFPTDRRAALYAYAAYLRWHIVVCAALAVAAGAVFFVMGEGMVYGNKSLYAPVTLMFAAWPFAAWFLSTLLLVRLTVRTGPKWYHLVIAAIAQIALLAAGIPLVMLLSAVTGARI